MPEPDIAEPDGRRRRAARSRQRIVRAATAPLRRRRLRGDDDRRHRPRRRRGDADRLLRLRHQAERAARPCSTRRSPATTRACPVRDQAWVDELARQTDPVGGRRAPRGRVPSAILARAAPVYDVVCHAAGEPEIGALFTANRAGRRARPAGARHVAAPRPATCAPGLDVETAADAVYALVNEEVYLLLVDDCGWDLDRFERWLADAAAPPAAGAAVTGRPHAHEAGLHVPPMTASTWRPHRRRHVPDRPATSRRGVRGRAPRPAGRGRPRRAAP